MYATDTIYGHGYSKYDTIQDDVADMYPTYEEESDDDLDLDDEDDVEFDLDEWEEI